MSEIDNVMKTLDQQWYNAIVEGCRLNKNQFQLYQGSQPLGDTSDTLWAIFDAVPPKSINVYYDPSQTNNFSTDYANVLNVMVSKGLSNLQAVLTDDYTAFMNAWKNTDETDMLKFFNSWCSKNCPDKCEDGSRAILAGQNDPIVIALNMWLKAGSFGSVKAYTTTIDQIKRKVQGTPSSKIIMQSQTMESSVNNTWAGASAGGKYKFFKANISGQYDKLAQKFMSSGFEVNATFDHVMTVAAGPLYQKNTSDVTLSKFEPWYLSSILSDAYKTRDNTVWMTGKTPNWESTFGSNGNMLRRASAVVIADGISITVSSNASLTKGESEDFKATAKAGIWPFFQVEGSGGWSNDYKYTDEGKMSVTMKCPNGNPNILGILQTQAPDYLS